MQTFVLAGGCFWCLDAVYRTLRGVSNVESGYTGGETEFPSYEEVCTGKTGHAEAVAVTFNEVIIPSDIILDVFFTLHDPTQLNRQGADVGTQYRSAMFPTDNDQIVVFTDALGRAAPLWSEKIVTRIERLGAWYPAEEYHQDFFAKNPSQGYCNSVAVPKVMKVRNAFAQYAIF